MPWQKLLESCVSETNPDQLEKLVFDTEDAIFLRFRELSTEPHLSDESRALKQAARKLLELKTEKLGWPDPAEGGGLPLPTEPHEVTINVQGCGKQDAPLTLYHIPLQGEPMPLGNGYTPLGCGQMVQHETASYIVFLCEDCSVRLGFPPMK